jgi:putative ABC transport system permease protein
MELLKLIMRNVFRQKLRSSLTILGVSTAVLAFCMLRSLVGAWYVGAEASSPNRMVTRNNISLVHMLPLSYRNKILQVNDVTGIAHGIWYGGIYKDKKNFFAQFVISGSDYLNLYPEFILSESEKRAFDRDRNAAIAGRKLADRFGWKIGDVIPLQGTIFPGNIELVLKGIYRGARTNVDETAFFFRYDYLNELLKAAGSDAADRVGWFIVRIKDPRNAAAISQAIDAVFQNSLAETLTETEKAFQLGFVAMTEAIVVSIEVISFVVIAIILMVLANTMAMTARERSSEYAVLKTLGFRGGFLYLLISGESVTIAMVGGIIGTIASFPGGRFFHWQLETFLPVFEVAPSTLFIALTASFLVGVLAALPPALRVIRIPIADGLSHLG